MFPPCMYHEIHFGNVKKVIWYVNNIYKTEMCRERQIELFDFIIELNN